MESVRQLRKAKGLTMKQLGEMCDVSESMIQMVEAGTRKPSFELLLKLGEALDCSVDDLINDKKIPATESDGKLLDLSMLSEDQRLAINAVVSSSPVILSHARPAIELLLSPQQDQDA